MKELFLGTGIAHTILLFAMLIGLLFCLRVMSGLFSITSISVQCGMLTAVFAIITEPMLRYLSILVTWIRELYIQVRLSANRQLHKMKNF